MKGTHMIDQIAPYWKAVVAFIAPAATILIASVQDGSTGGEAITVAEWVTALCTCIVTAAAVYTVPNKPAPAEPGGPVIAEEGPAK